MNRYIKGQYFKDRPKKEQFIESESNFPRLMNPLMPSPQMGLCAWTLLLAGEEAQPKKQYTDKFRIIKERRELNYI